MPSSVQNTKQHQTTHTHASIVQRFISIGLLSAGLFATLSQPGWAEQVPITLLHLNDIYEITPVEGGRRGGLARVATIRQQLLARNPRTFTLLAGDVLSPSALGTARVNGERLAGRQMVAVMNALGLDYATFGNHEFDLSRDALLQRLQESQFQWISTNVNQANGEPFAGIPRTQIVTVRGEHGTPVRLGLLGVTLPSNPADYVQYEDAIAAARTAVTQLHTQVDIVVAITHLSLAQDQQLAAAVPEIDLIVGGHEHENIQQWRMVERPKRSEGCTDQGTLIAKADANARTVYIHDLTYDTTTRCLVIASRLQVVTDAVPETAAIAKLVQTWQDKGFQGFRETGFQPERIVAVTTQVLDGLESSVRNHPTALTDLIAEAMLREVGQADLAMFNGGSIRIDDRLPAGPITQYDVIRILPFGGKVLAVEMPGALLQRVLEQGQANRGQGGFLQTIRVTRRGEQDWLVQGQPLQPERRYVVAINDFLMSGREQGLEFLSLQTPGVNLLAEKGDLRFAVIRALQNQAVPQRR